MDSVVQPDLAVVCDPAKIVEREYLTIDPSGRWLHLYRLGAGGRYGGPEVLLLEEGRPAPRVRLEVPPGFGLDLARLFP